MANKRIRDLVTTSTFPTGALFPLDAAGLTEANAISGPDLIDVVSSEIIPRLVPNSQGAANDNTAAIDAALATYAVYGNSRANASKST